MIEHRKRMEYGKTLHLLAIAQVGHEIAGDGGFHALHVLMSHTMMGAETLTIARAMHENTI